MRTILFHDRVDPEAWDEHAAVLGGGFFHCHAGVVYSARVIKAIPLFVEALDDAGRCVGLAGGTVSSSRVWPFSRYCQIAAFPATPVAGGDRGVEEQFLAATEGELRRNGVFRVEFASQHSPNSDWLLPGSGYAITCRHEYHFDLGRNLDDLFGAFAPQRRNQVRRAEKRGVATFEKSTPETVDLVRHFHNLSMARRQEPFSPLKPWVAAARKALVCSGHARVLISTMDGEPICADLFAVFSGKVYGLESGSSDLGNQNCSPVHLTWSAIRHFKESGATCLSLGGARHYEEGLRKFKLEFGTVQTPQPIGYKILGRFGACLNSVRSAWRNSRGPGLAGAESRPRHSSRVGPRPADDDGASPAGGAT